MALRRLLPPFLATLLFSVVVVIPYTPESRGDSETFNFELQAASSTEAIAQVFFDQGSGYSERLSASQHFEAGPEFQTLQFRMTDGTYTGIRVDPIDRTGVVSIRGARIVSSTGKVFREFGPESFRAANQVASAVVRDGRLQVTTVAGANDPYLVIAFGEILTLRRSISLAAWALARRWAPIFVVSELLVLGLLLAGAGVRGRIRSRLAQLWCGCTAHPQRAVALAAAIAAILSSYPVVFLGKSFVSPNFGPVALLNNSADTIPGSRSNGHEDVRASDVGAVMWMHLPLTSVEHRAVFQHGELPLWNRYNATGAPLLGQSQSMVGDPVHMLLPFLFDGAAWAWDMKYVVAKWLLACGLGLSVWHLTRHLPAALFLAATADFIGFFLFRVNHPAIFSLCYAPWILYCWLRAVQSPDLRGTARWAAGLVVANLAEMTSGTAKEAYMLLLFLNLTGCVMLLLAREPAGRRLRRLAILAGAGVVFLLVSAPISVSFVVALRNAFTVYDNPEAQQVPPGLFAGLFDEILYRPFNQDFLYFPSASFVYLVGLLGFLVYLRDTTGNRPALAVALGIILPFSLAFGLIPAGWIIRVPLLANVVHIGNTFTCVVIIHLGVLAGCGFASAARRLGGEAGRVDLAIGVLLFSGLIAAYLPALYRRETSYFVQFDIAAIVVAALGLMVVSRLILARRRATPATAIIAVTCVLVLTWRFGFQYGTGFPGYVLNPPARADFSVKSRAVEAVLAERDPYRAAGVADNLLPGWSATYGMEGYAGPEPLINRYYRELLDVSGITQVWGWRYVVLIESLPQLRPIYDFLNIRYYFQQYSDPTRFIGVLKPFAAADIDVYQSETPWPRAYFTDRVLHYREPQDLIALIKAQPGQPFAAVQDSDNDVPTLRPPAGAPAPAAAARNYRLTTNRTSFDVDATGPGVIALQEAWGNREFRVTVNGKAAEYFRVNHLFKGVKVDGPGSYHVEYEYWPPFTTLSLVLGAAGLLILAGGTTLLFLPDRRLPGFLQPRSAIPSGSPAG